MSDTAEYWHRQYEALKREHVALIEQAAALQYQIAQQDESIERLYEERNAWKTEAQEGRKQAAALRAAIINLERLLAAPEAAP